MNSAASTLACPRCGVLLVAGPVQGATLLGCGACGGIWLDNPSATRVLHAYDAAVAALVERADRNARAHPELRPMLTCPSCRAPMQRKTTFGVDLDLCNLHGTWFDAGELSFLLGALRPPPVAHAHVPDEAPVFTAPESGGGVGWGGVALGILGVLGDILDDG